MPESTFGELVRAARKGRGLTLDELGEAVGVDHARASRIERGLAKPTAREVHGIVQRLGLDADEALTLAAKVALPASDDATDHAPEVA